MKKFLLIPILFLLAVQAQAWGPTGHRVVGQIAEHHLSPKAKNVIMDLLNNESLASVSIYMDEIKADPSYDHFKNWHWVTIPDGMTYDESEKSPKGDVISAILTISASIKKGELTREEKVFAIKQLVHFVGDIHQPLHVGKPGDYGGNKVKVVWFKDSTNLHHVWDENLIQHYKMSYTELADNLIRTKQDLLNTEWENMDVKVWALESMSYRESVYNIGDGQLGYEYHYNNFEIVEKRLLQSGLRLAALLNDLFG